jgi:nucleotide-binding universal stress UspA family protein
MTGIVVGIDGSEGGTIALRWAVEEGRLRSWPVTAVLAWDYLAQPSLDAEAHFDPEFDQSKAEAYLDAHLTQLLGDGASAVQRRVVNDKAAPALLEAAADAELLVVGARGLGGFKGLLLGSVSRACIEHAPCPVAVIHAPRDGATAPSEPARVVVGTDGSPDALAAMRWAADAARARGGVLQVLHSWQLPLIGGYLDGAPQFDPAEIESYAERTLDGAIAELAVDGLTVEPLLVPAGSAEALIEASAGASLVVVGHRGLSRLAGFLLGSTSLRVAQHAAAPVVLVPHDG